MRMMQEQNKTRSPGIKGYWAEGEGYSENNIIFKPY